MTNNQRKNPLVLYNRENTELNYISNMKRSVDNKEISTKLRKDKLNIINLKESNLTSTISDSKQKEKNNKLLKKFTLYQLFLLFFYSLEVSLIYIYFQTFFLNLNKYSI